MGPFQIDTISSRRELQQRLLVSIEDLGSSFEARLREVGRAVKSGHLRGVLCAFCGDSASSKDSRVRCCSALAHALRWVNAAMNWFDQVRGFDFGSHEGSGFAHLSLDVGSQWNWLAGAILSVLLLAACGTVKAPANSSGSQSTAPATITISVSPDSANLATGAAQVFSATLSGAAGSAVTLSGVWMESPAGMRRWARL